MKRINSIDFTRGIVMIIMALDHVRDMMHIHAIDQSPTNLSTTTPALFLTRWITYLCAPTFVFLAGSSAYISFKNKGNVAQSRSFLLKRGIWLIVLEFTLVNFALFFDIGFHSFIFEVIATIGFGFIVLSLLLKASPKTIGIVGLIMVICHALVPLIPLAESSLLKKIWMPLFALGAFPFSNKVFIIAYPPIPWLGIMLVGFASGKFFGLANEKRENLFVKIGLSALLLFFVARFINIYGDPVRWTAQKNSTYTFLSFMNVSKYPPSPLFCLVTLGILFLVLAFADHLKGRYANIVSVYGKVPLFYFLTHFYLIHITMILLMFIQGFSWSQMDFATGALGRPKGVESGVHLWAIYVIWVAVVFLMYWPCLWFGKYKTGHKQWWLKYL